MTNCVINSKHFSCTLAQVNITLFVIHKSDAYQYYQSVYILPWHELVAVDAELQEAEENGGDVQVRLPHREAAAQQVDGRPPDGRVRRHR